MTTTVMNYTVNPIANFFKRLYKGMVRVNMVIGYSRAAAHLSNMGYHKEAKETMDRLSELLDENK